MSENYDSSPLPPGWDRKYDHRTGRYYFINYFNKTTTWEDPRLRYRQLNQVTPQHVPAPTVIENIPMQTLDSRGFHIYPSNASHFSPQHSFQSSGNRGQSAVRFQELSNVRPSPVQSRSHVATHTTPYSSPARTAETSMTTDTNLSVAKISAMFPTVSDTHIKTLLMKYLKSVFPKVEETLLLDILSNADNNVQKATEKLLSMGFEKRDTPPPRLTLRRKEEEQKVQEQNTASPAPPPRMKSLEEKQKMKATLQNHYPDIPERVITIALESVDYDEDRAAHILEFMVQEEKKAKSVESKPIVPESKPQEVKTTVESKPSTSEVHVETELESPAPKTPVRKPSTSDKPEKGLSKRSKGKKDVSKVSRGTSTTEDKEYKSPYIMKTGGPDPTLHKGPNDELLLLDYVTWNGPNPELLNRSGGYVSLAKGPDKSLLGERTYHAKGPNSELRKGPLIGLAKGSIYSQLNDNNSGESRGK